MTQRCIRPNAEPDHNYADAHYHHLVDDVIEGGRLEYEDGAIRVPDGPGLGVSLDRERLAHYAGLFEELGGYPYDRDPGRPGWFALVPNTDFADPTVSITPPLTSGVIGPTRVRR